MNVIFVGVAIIAGLTLLAAIGVAVTRRYLHHQVREGHNDVLVPLFLMAGTLYAVLLGFLVIAVWETFEAARTNIADEATTIVALYRLTNGMQDKEGDHMRHLIREYVENVIHDEWELQSHEGQASNKARKAVGDMDRAFRDMDPKTKLLDAQIHAAFLQTVAQVVAHRNKRLVQAKESLSWVMWLSSIGGGLITVLMTFLLFMEKTWPHILMSSAMATLIGLLLFVVVVLNRPFVGPVALEPEPFEATLKTLDAVDQGY